MGFTPRVRFIGCIVRTLNHRAVLRAFNPAVYSFTLLGISLKYLLLILHVLLVLCGFVIMSGGRGRH